LPPRPQRLPPLRAFHLSASRSQLARVKHLIKGVESGRGKWKTYPKRRHNMWKIKKG